MKENYNYNQYSIERGDGEIIAPIGYNHDLFYRLKEVMSGTLTPEKIKWFTHFKENVCSLPVLGEEATYWLIDNNNTVVDKFSVEGSKVLNDDQIDLESMFDTYVQSSLNEYFPELKDSPEMEGIEKAWAAYTTAIWNIYDHEKTYENK